MATYRYTHGPGIDEPLSRENLTTGTIEYYHADGLGSIVKMTSSTGAVVQARHYDAYGNLEVGADAPGFAYTGREWDPEIGLYFYRARYHDPKIGRFASEDPIRFRGGINFYVYVPNNPVRSADPSGLALPPGSTFGPHPPPGPPLVDVPKFWDEFLQGARDMIRNNATMRQRGWLGADKYYHRMANCEAASRGAGGIFASQVGNELREDYGWWKGDPMSDAFEDMEGNRCGRRGGASGKNCQQECAPFIPQSSPGNPPFIPWGDIGCPL